MILIVNSIKENVITIYDSEHKESILANFNKSIFQCVEDYYNSITFFCVKDKSNNGNEVFKVEYRNVIYLVENN